METHDIMIKGQILDMVDVTKPLVCILMDVRHGATISKMLKIILLKTWEYYLKR